jgi:hypothetical protein
LLWRSLSLLLLALEEKGKELMLTAGRQLWLEEKNPAGMKRELACLFDGEEELLCLYAADDLVWRRRAPLLCNREAANNCLFAPSSVIGHFPVFSGMVGMSFVCC